MNNCRQLREMLSTLPAFHDSPWVARSTSRVVIVAQLRCLVISLSLVVSRTFFQASCLSIQAL